MLLSQFTFKLNNSFHHNNPAWPLIAHFAWAMGTLCESRMLPAQIVTAQVILHEDVADAVGQEEIPFDQLNFAGYVMAVACADYFVDVVIKVRFR
jgi:hypothetical protein